LGLPQPAWRQVYGEDDLAAFGFPVWVKAAFSTAGRGVRAAHDLDDARAAWKDLAGSGDVMVQRGVPGVYAQVQGVFSHGLLIGAATSELVATGVGGSAAPRLSVDHPEAVAALRTLGRHLTWHGGIDLDYFHVGGEPRFIECNPRTVEPGNAFFAGVNLPKMLLAVAEGASVPDGGRSTRAGVRTRSTMEIAPGATERRHTRRAVISSVTSAITRRPALDHSAEVLTPVFRDAPSLFPFVYAVGTVLASPRQVTRLAGDTVSDYGITTAEVDIVRPPRH